MWGAVAVRKTDHKYNWLDYRRAVFGIAGQGVELRRKSVSLTGGPTSCYSVPQSNSDNGCVLQHNSLILVIVVHPHIISAAASPLPSPAALFARKWSIDMFRPTRDSHSRSADAVHRVRPTCFSMFNVLSSRRLLPRRVFPFDVSAYAEICRGNLEFLRGGLTVSRNLR